jgi:cytochrome c
MAVFPKVVALNFVLTFFLLNHANASEEIPAGDISLKDVPLFVEKARCIACHGLEEFRVGPPWKAISAMYSGRDRSAESLINYLAYKIRYGGAGVWGVTPMIEYEGITQEQAKIIAEWILRLEKK